MSKPIRSNASPRREPSTRLDAGASREFTTSLRTLFYRKMRHERVYPLIVRTTDAGTGVRPVAAEIVVRPMIPGAIVTPPQQSVDAAMGGNDAAFQITPVAKGKLKGARLNIYQDGKLIESASLGMRTTTQRMTWALALVSLMFFGWLLYYTQITPLSGRIPRELSSADESARKAAALLNGAPDKKDEDKPKADAAKPDAAKPDGVKPDQPNADKAKSEGAGATDKKPDEKKPEGGNTPAVRQPQAGAGDQGRQTRGGQGRPRRAPSTPGGQEGADALLKSIDMTQKTDAAIGSANAFGGLYLNYLVKRAIYKTIPDIKFLTTSKPETVMREELTDANSYVAYGIGYGFDFVATFPRAQFYVLALLCAIVFLSWYFHKAKASRITTKISLTTSHGDARHGPAPKSVGLGETIPLAEPLD